MVDFYVWVGGKFRGVMPFATHLDACNWIRDYYGDWAEFEVFRCSAFFGPPVPKHLVFRK